MRLFCLAVLIGGLASCSSSQVPQSETEEARVAPSVPPPPDQSEPVFETGRWHAFSRAPDARLDREDLSPEELARILALPYVAGSQPAPELSGVTIFRSDKVLPGWNLYNSGHGPEAFVTGLEGTVVHRWSYPIEEIWPDARGVHQSSYWRRVHWLPDGDLLAIFEGIGLIRLDRQSNLEWAYRELVHHQAVLDRDGSILTLVRRPVVLPRINPEKPVLEDFLARLSPDGELIEEISLLEAFERSQYAELLEGMKREGDIFHTNSIEVLDGRFAHRAPWLKRGNLLLSIFFLDLICVLAPEQKNIVWAVRGDQGLHFRGQHDPRLLPSGRLLLLDNWGRSGKSQVIEFDPLTLEVAWRYPPVGASSFHTPTCGTSQRLANGNTLITESDRGRAFEVTPEGAIVWEFLNPHRAGTGGELIATLFEVRRVPLDYFSWLNAKPDLSTSN